MIQLSFGLYILFGIGMASGTVAATSMSNLMMNWDAQGNPFLVKN